MDQDYLDWYEMTYGVPYVSPVENLQRHQAQSNNTWHLSPEYKSLTDWYNKTYGAPDVAPVENFRSRQWQQTVDPTYLGQAVPGRQTRVKPYNWTNLDTFSMTNPGGWNLTKRPVTREFESSKSREGRTNLAAYSPTNRSIPFATQVGPTRAEIFNTPVPSFGASPGPGGPSVYARETPRNDPDYEMVDVDGTPRVQINIKGGQNPRYVDQYRIAGSNPNLQSTYTGGYVPPRSRFYEMEADPRYKQNQDIKSREVEAEEGPARGLSQWALKKAAEMISASQEGAPTARAFTTRMGTREYQPYMVSPKVGSLASLYLRKREEEV